MQFLDIHRFDAAWPLRLVIVMTSLSAGWESEVREFNPLFVSGKQ